MAQNITEIKKFKLERLANIKKIGHSKKLKRLATDFINLQAPHKYSYNFDWLGLPIIQLPQDILAMQEIIWRIKPDLIIETGIARGGSLIFYASMLELLGKGEVLGIDIDIRKYNKREIERHRMFKRIKMIGGSSTDGGVIQKVAKVAKGHKKILVCLDSMHTRNHVLRELELYSPFVSRGSYLVVFDTVIECMDEKLFKNRPWTKGNNPASAVRDFLEINSDFIVDTEFDNKLAISFTPGGYLRRIK
ncbi:MAG: cephalosporin hydroxylase family protein [bacterium]|nr:cephalosporin hydroxylase family protein [bacterium]